MRKLTTLEEARYRLACCRAKTGDGWGDKHSLRNHLHCNVGPRLHELEPFVEEIRGLPEMHDLRRGLTTVDLLYEYHDLVSIQTDIRFYLQVDLPQRPTHHHVLPLNAGMKTLCYLISTAAPGDFIHCSHEACQKLGIMDHQHANEKGLTFIFPTPPHNIEDELRRLNV